MPLACRDPAFFSAIHHLLRLPADRRVAPLRPSTSGPISTTTASESHPTTFYIPKKLNLSSQMAKKRGRLQEALKSAISQQKQKPSQPQGPPSKKQKTSQNRPQQQQSNKPKKKHHQPSQSAPIIPFTPTDTILLLGEADLSFSASLSSHHKCTALTSTVFEPSLPALQEKYPHVDKNISLLLSPPNAHPNSPPNNNKLLYNIDATKLSLKSQSFSRIIFNFPHIGGKSKDVNRQVRANQEMMVGFFRRALLHLAPRGKIIVTLFEGEPYTLWNIRDLARHAGLEVERSFRFQAGAYPGYAHARTLGVVRNKKTGEVSERAWKGERRESRSFVFVRKGEGEKAGPGQGKNRKQEGEKPGQGQGKKRKQEEEESEEEEEEEEFEGWGESGEEEEEEEEDVDEEDEGSSGDEVDGDEKEDGDEASDDETAPKETQG
uniref:25S rRNA (uridine-N(3))-methyltransferase BMT5-like domain-containing protein n=1 Tax=Podospora anserina (strain S / ATCC MYA-4624 / DSM 980 / FGSC 10383) TaxID=515849 RepID=A0A090CWR3_PODAN|nr:Putative protein of unknown function [Podospora anserina S mat+]